MYSKFHNPSNGLTPGSLITSKKDSDILESNEESFGTEDEEFNDTKDFKVVRVDKDNGIEDEEDVEIIEISCCPRIRFDFLHASNKQQILFKFQNLRITSLGLLSQLYPYLIGVYTKIDMSPSSQDRRQVYRMTQPDAQFYISKPATSSDVT